jgi:tRNA pseudouridine55 synthase
MDALFNVYKPKGPTSHDVVARLRRASGVRRIGHAGTLDPLAEGVLVVAVGQATRLIEYLAKAEKEYLAEVTFGVETETDDAEGRVIAQRSIEGLDRGRLEAVLPQFVGEIEQRPPAYSAVNVGGRRLYELARRGQDVEAPMRRVRITRLALQEWSPPVAKLLVECSKGTYIRSLARDLGRALGCGAYLSGLVRLRVGRFVAHNAVPLDELEERLRRGEWPAVALPVDAAVAHLPRVDAGPADARRLAHGLPVARAAEPAAFAPAPAGGAPEDASRLARVHGPDGRLLAIVEASEHEGQAVWRPVKVLVTAAAPSRGSEAEPGPAPADGAAPVRSRSSSPDASAVAASRTPRGGA